MRKNFKKILFVAGMALCLGLTGCGMQDENKSTGSQPEAVASENSPEAESEPLYTVILDTKITHISNYVGFINESKGITVGTDGEIHYTTDGGKTWPRSQNQSHCRFGMDIVDENLIWTCGNHNHIRMSTDGGLTFKEVSDFSRNLTQGHITFLDDKTGWVATEKHLALTEDGAQTWEELTLPENEKGIASIYLKSPKEGYFLSSTGVLYATDDLGSNWQARGRLPVSEMNLSDLNGNGGLIHVGRMPNAEMSFQDEKNGTIVLIGFIDKVGFKTYLLQTQDGGLTWTETTLTLPEEYVATSVFLTKDGQYMTLSSNQKRLLVLKRKG